MTSQYDLRNIPARQITPHTNATAHATLSPLFTSYAKTHITPHEFTPHHTARFTDHTTLTAHSTPHSPPVESPVTPHNITPHHILHRPQNRIIPH